MSTLYITTQGAQIQKRSGQFLVTKSGKLIDTIPEIHVKQIVLSGNINLSTPAIAFCLDKEIEVVFLSQGGKFLGRINGDTHRAVELRRKQYEKSFNGEFCLLQAKAFVTGKIRNQLSLVKQQIKNEHHPGDFGNLKRLLQKAELTTSAEKLLGIEGAASATYFRMFGNWIPEPFMFNKRTANPPKDEVNSLLSLSYTLLYNRITSHLNMLGLDPYLGFFHKTRNGHAALASDLMEEFRPVFADALILRLIRRRQLKPDDFSRSAGRFLLNDNGKRIFFSEFENKMASKRNTKARNGWRLSYAQIIKCQAQHMVRVINGDDEKYEAFNVF